MSEEEFGGLDCEVLRSVGSQLVYAPLGRRSEVREAIRSASKAAGLRVSVRSHALNAFRVVVVGRFE